MDTHPLGTFELMLPFVLEPSGAGALNTSFAEVEDDEAGGVV